jgi:Fibronectin type III domain
VVTTIGHDAGQVAQVGGSKKRSKGAIVTISVVVGLVAAMGLTLLGLGVADDAVANYDASSWLWSTTKSEMARVNGVTSRVDTRLQVPSAQGHTMQVTQTDRYLILRDLNTGQVSAIDLATLQVAATTQTTAGIGVSVALHKDAAFVIDAVQGVVRQLDPHSLAPIGEPVRYPPGITGGVFDGDGRLWIGVPTEGTVSAITPAPLPSGDAAGGAGGGLSPKLVQTLAIAAPSHELAISALDDGVAVLDRTTSTLTTFRGGNQRSTPLDLSGPGAMPNRTNGGEVPVTVVDNRHVYVVNGTAVHDFAVPGDGGQLRPAVAWAGRLYVADDATGKVYVLDTNGKLVKTIAVKGANGPLELEVREGYLFINAPSSPYAQVVDDKGKDRTVDKYANDILGGDPPKDPPPPPPPPRKPRVSPPGPPKSVVATAGNATARVSWQPAAANGAAITKYVVEADGKTYDVGANQRSLEVTGLTNGQTYRFTVHAVNSKGAGPERTSNPVVPSSEVPDPPASVTAKENKDGTVTVSWPAANGQGHAIKKYAVTAVSAGANAPAGESTSTELVVPAGTLEYGQQYAFTVIAVNDKGTGSKASPVSNSVVPYTVPGKPQALDAATVGDQKGAISVTWQAAADNGRPITKYVVSGGGKSQDVTNGTSATLTGFSDGQNVSVTVHAVNEAGDGPDATASAKTLAAPTLTVTSKSSDHSSITVNFSVNDGGGTASCSLTADGKTASGNCSSLKVAGLLPSTSYNFTVKASNAAGQVTANGSQATATVTGKSVCVNNTSSSDPAQHTWCNDPANGMEIFSGTSQSSTRLGRGSNGQQFDAICKASGERINDYVYNPGKMGTSENDGTTVWIKLKYSGGTGYMSFAWFNLNGYGVNETGPLPNC